MRFGSVAIVVLTLSLPLPAVARPMPQEAAAASAPAPVLSDAQIVEFLENAKVVKTKSIGKGVTGAVRATLSDGTLIHDAQIQKVDEKRAEFSAGKVREFNFEDSWKFNVAAYRVDRLIGLEMVPVSVSRTWKSDRSAFTWWLDDVQMDEGARIKSQQQPPDSGIWNERMQLVKLFDQLIGNTDRNSGNLLIGHSWQVWAIDHTRAFRTQNTLPNPASITRCDRQVLAGLKALSRDVLKREIGDFVTDFQIAALLARRDQIVALIEKAGPTGVFDRRR
ncbi:MAG: hypothetical protein ABIX28_25520 [Vicinamibacterales bacterium]